MNGNALGDKLKSLRSSFSTPQLVMIGILTVATLIGTLAFVSWVSQPSYRVLSAGAPSDTNKAIVADLESKSIPYKLENGGSTILVRSSDLSRAKLDTVAGAGAAGQVAGLELFDKQGFTTSDFQQRVGYQRALQGEITRAILSISGIESATVQLALPPERLFSRDQQSVRASVLLGSVATISPSTVNSVVQLVAAAVPGLDPNDVTVTDTRGRVLANGSSGTSSEDRRVELTQSYELALAAKAEGMLAEVYGPGRVTVRVSAELNLDDRKIETTTYKQNSAVPIRKATTTESFTGAGGPLPEGTTGVEGGVAAGAAAGANNKYDRNELTEESVVDTNVETSTKAPGSIERLSAAAIIDQGLEPAPNPATIKSIISAAIGARDDRDTVVVETIAFDEETKAKNEEAAQAAVGAAKQAEGGMTAIFGYVRMGVGVVLLVLVLLFLRRGLRSSVETLDVPAAAAAPAAAGSRAIDLDADLPAELKLIDVRTDELATVLRSWVADRREVVR